MFGSNLQGQWMASSVIEGDIKKLREARYLTAEISHMLPAQGQVIPTPEPNESVVFVSHFLQGLGCSLDPFVLSFTSRRLSPCVKPSSAPPPTSAYVSRPST